MIYGEINRQRLKIIREHVVADTIDYLEARFTFSDDWDGLEKWTHFSKNGTVYDIRLTDDCIRKEDHLNLSAGLWKVYLHGNEYRDGEVIERITTDTAVLEVRPTGTLDGEPFPEMPASVTEQILARLENVEQNGGGAGGTGISPEATVERTEDGAVITIRDKNGETSAHVYDGEPGVYVGSETPPPGTKVWVNPDGEESEDDAVRYVPQELTPEQQAQARRNIDAAAQEEVNRLSAAKADFSVVPNAASVDDGVLKMQRTTTDGETTTKQDLFVVKLPQVNDAVGSGVWYGSTATNATTAEKVVTTVTGDFKLTRGSVVSVKFLTNSVNCGFLIVDGTAKTPIRSSYDEAVNDDGSDTSSTDAPTLWHNKGEIIWFVYDGKYFIVTNGKSAGEETVGLVNYITIRSEAAKNHYTKIEIDNKLTALDEAIADAIGSGVIE